MANGNEFSKTIYSRDDYEKLLREKRRLHDLLETYDKAESCGVNCDVYRGINATQMEALEQFERNFFTPPPQ